MPQKATPSEKKFTEAEKRTTEAQIVEQAKRIDFYLTEYSVELLAQKMEKGDFEIPAYQREDTWEPERKSRFIESLLIGLPIPFLIFWEKPETGKLEVVDGSQRLRTIQQFVLGTFVLGELETLTELEGMRFGDLLTSRQRKVNNRSIRGIVLNEHADEQARFDIFDRINTGSKIANKAEVRRGALIGPFLDMVIDLATDPLFGELAPFTQKSVNLREREELVTRFFAYGDGLADYRDRPADFLFKYAKKMNAHFLAHPQAVEAYRRRFRDTMTFVKKVFPYGFRKSPSGIDTPRARFESIAIGAYTALKQDKSLARRSPDVSWLGEPEFQTVIGSDGANAIARLKGRIEFVRDPVVAGGVTWTSPWRSKTVSKKLTATSRSWPRWRTRFRAAFQKSEAKRSRCNNRKFFIPRCTYSFTIWSRPRRRGASEPSPARRQMAPSGSPPICQTR